jgi:hypothetical protein
VARCWPEWPRKWDPSAVHTKPKNDPDGALRLALFVGSLSPVDEQQVVALLEVINHEQLLTRASLALLVAEM